MSKIEEFEALLKKPPSPEKIARIQKQHEEGKLTAVERISILVDEGSFEEFGEFVRHRCYDFGMAEKTEDGDGVICGFGTINGRPVGIFAHDFTVFGGTISEMNARKICFLMDRCLDAGIPIIGINDSGGARIQEGILSLAGYAEIFYRNVIASGVIPQISIIAGPCAGGAVYSPALTDFIIMVENISYMFVTGPRVTKSVTGEDVSFQELGGARVHATKSGVASFTCLTEEETYLLTRHLIGYLPLNCEEKPPRVPYTPGEEERPRLREMIPEDPSAPYDVREIIREIVDENSFLEVQPEFATNIVVGFARMGGRVVGIVANQPLFNAGTLDINSSRKAARFVRFCDCFNIPLIVLEDVPGFMPGTQQEWNGIIIHGAKLLYAFCEATVPRITFILRKAYGGAYDVMNSYHIGGDFVFALPTAEVAVMGAKGAVEILFKKELENAPDKEEKLKELETMYNSTFANPYRAAAYNFVHKIILPEELRKKALLALDILDSKARPRIRRKHGNIPL